jgi:hypothetical protein
VLAQGREYLLFERVDYVQQGLITTMTRSAVVMTANVIAVIPLESTDGETLGDDALRFIKALLDDPAVDVEKLDSTLVAMYQGARSCWVFPIAQLDMLKVKTGFFGMVSFRPRRDSIRRLAIRDKGGKAAAKAFLEARPRERAA